MRQRAEQPRASQDRQRRRKGFVLRVSLLWAGLVLCMGGAARQAAGEETGKVDLQGFAAQLATAGGIAAACAGNSQACDPGTVPGRERVEGGPHGPFTVGWQWMAEALTAAKTATPAQRLHGMQAVEAHLAVLKQESGASGQSTVGGAVPDRATFARARDAANAALARDEFRASAGPSWWERKLARVQDWFFGLFAGMDRLGRKAPWLAPLIEWSCFGLAVAGLLWFVRQNLARQALRITLTESAAFGRGGGLDTADWARLAEEQAGAGQWREAIHSLYWAAIALMESRRAWRPNVTRTPREYLRLLRPGSEAHGALRELTRGFERTWYGLALAGEDEYRRARGHLETMRGARAERAGEAQGGPRVDAALSPAGGA